MSLPISFEDKTASRRQFGHVLLAGAVGVALTACGGGNDPTGVTDDATSNGPDLEKAYYKISAGMLKDDVIAVVGVAPNDSNGREQISWYYSSGQLTVHFDWTDGKGYVSRKIWDPANGPNIAQEY